MLEGWSWGRCRGKVCRKRNNDLMITWCFFTGEMTWTSGDKYIGDWEDNVRSGHGLYLYASGNRYKGQYVRGRKVR